VKKCVYHALNVLQHFGDEDEAKTVQIPVPPKPVVKYPAVFRWTGAGQEVSIAGSFNSWQAKIPLVKRSVNKLTLFSEMSCFGHLLSYGCYCVECFLTSDSGFGLCMKPGGVLHCCGSA